MVESETTLPARSGRLEADVIGKVAIEVAAPLQEVLSRLFVCKFN
jgi:hypothetical protein